MDVSGLKYGLHQHFTDNNKHINKNVAVECEALSAKLYPFIKDDWKENFHECFRSISSIMSNSVYRGKAILLN